MAEQPCLGSVDLPTLASCDPLNHYLACPPSACMEASKPTLLPAGQYTFLLVGLCATLFVQLCLCAILCQSVSRPSEVVVTYGLRGVWKNLVGTSGNLLQDGQSLVNVPSSLAQPFLLLQHSFSTKNSLHTAPFILNV